MTLWMFSRKIALTLIAWLATFSSILCAITRKFWRHDSYGPDASTETGQGTRCVPDVHRKNAKKRALGAVPESRAPVGDTYSNDAGVANTTATETQRQNGCSQSDEVFDGSPTGEHQKASSRSISSAPTAVDDERAAPNAAGLSENRRKCMDRLAGSKNDTHSNPPAGSVDAIGAALRQTAAVLSHPLSQSEKEGLLNDDHAFGNAKLARGRMTLVLAIWYSTKRAMWSAVHAVTKFTSRLAGFGQLTQVQDNRQNRKRPFRLAAWYGILRAFSFTIRSALVRIPAALRNFTRAIRTGRSPP